MRTSARVGALALLLLPLAGAAHLPAEYKVCKRGDANIDACLQKALNDVVKKLGPGIPSLGVVPIDPLEVPQLSISDDNNKNLNLKITFRNIRVTGLTNGEILTVRPDLDNNKLFMEGVEPLTIFEADYTMDGKFLVVPVKGSGKCKFTFNKMSATLGVEAERKKKNGEEFWDVKRFPVDIKKLESLQVNFENLFNGDPNLGPNFNRLLNENWKDFWGALQPTFEESFGLLFLDFARKVFDKVPLSEVFPQ